MIDKTTWQILSYIVYMFTFWYSYYIYIHVKVNIFTSVFIQNVFPPTWSGNQSRQQFCWTFLSVAAGWLAYLTDSMFFDASLDSTIDRESNADALLLGSTRKVFFGGGRKWCHKLLCQRSWRDEPWLLSTCFLSFRGFIHVNTYYMSLHVWHVSSAFVWYAIYIYIHYLKWIYNETKTCLQGKLVISGCCLARCDRWNVVHFRP